MSKIFSLVFLFITLSQIVVASTIGEVFGTGVFGASWGMDMAAIEEIFPNGKAVEYVGITQFETKNGRTVLNVERKKSNKISFSFDSEGRLTAVGVYYQSTKFGELQSTLKTLFGPYLNKPNSFGTILEWSQKDNVKLSLMQVSSDVVFTIEYFGLDKPVKSKKDLGF